MLSGVPALDFKWHRHTQPPVTARLISPPDSFCRSHCGSIWVLIFLFLASCCSHNPPVHFSWPSVTRWFLMQLMQWQDLYTWGNTICPQLVREMAICGYKAKFNAPCPPALRNICDKMTCANNIWTLFFLPIRLRDYFTFQSWFIFL